jgi:hypothetical protein
MTEKRKEKILLNAFQLPHLTEKNSNTSTLGKIPGECRNELLFLWVAGGYTPQGLNPNSINSCKINGYITILAFFLFCIPKEL